MQWHPPIVLGMPSVQTPIVGGNAIARVLKFTHTGIQDVPSIRASGLSVLPEDARVHRLDAWAASQNIRSRLKTATACALLETLSLA